MALIKLQNVSVSFPVYNISARSFKKNLLRLATGGKIVEDSKKRMVIDALDNITISLKDGDRIGLIGHNGAGKSTFLRLLAQIYEPTNGQLHIQGKVSPMLNITHGIEGEFTGYENITLRGTVMGLSKKEIENNIEKIAEFSELGDYLHMPIRTYSSGMMVRLAFAISTCMDPEILLIDEIFAAGDANFMAKARMKMVSLLNASSIFILASHSDVLLKEFCNKGIILEKGKVKYFGDIQEALDQYRGYKQSIKKAQLCARCLTAFNSTNN